MHPKVLITVRVKNIGGIVLHGNSVAVGANIGSVFIDRMYMYRECEGIGIIVEKRL